MPKLIIFYHFDATVWVAEWPPFGKQLPTRLAICLHCILSIWNFTYFPFWFWEWDLSSDCPSSCSLLSPYFFSNPRFPQVLLNVRFKCKSWVIFVRRCFRDDNFEYWILVSDPFYTILTSRRNASSKMMHTFVNIYRACAKHGFLSFLFPSLVTAYKRFGLGTHFYQNLCWVTIFKKRPALKVLIFFGRENSLKRWKVVLQTQEYCNFLTKANMKCAKLK